MGAARAWDLHLPRPKGGKHGPRGATPHGQVAAPRQERRLACVEASLPAVDLSPTRTELRLTPPEARNGRAVSGPPPEAATSSPMRVWAPRLEIGTRDPEARGDGGLDIRTIQELLEHRDVSTTMIDARVLNRGGLAVRSPFDPPPALRR